MNTSQISKFQVESSLESLSVEDWSMRAKKHRSQAQAWTEPCRARRACRKIHPVYDFLFTYYPFSLGRLEQWHPGLDISLEMTVSMPEIFSKKHYKRKEGYVLLAPETLSDKERYRIKHIHNLLTLTQHRTANYSCFGMHEWAMVYRGDHEGEIRHRESAPLRLPQQDIDQLVESRSLCCSHFDAFRFFAPSAIALNKLQPTLEQRAEFEQPGCLHSNMDLYKWASKCMPWVGTDLLWQCFLLALSARELDMRASPYNLTDYNYEAIPVETADGRAQYEQAQRQITEEAQPIRQQLIDTLARLLQLAR